MSSKKKDSGGQAFPRAGFSGPAGFGKPEYGMNLRDWFAGQALAGMMANCDESGVNGWNGIELRASKVAYKFADAMLEARK